jgi:hypothetical protein
MRRIVDSRRVLNHMRSNAVGYLALFVALGGTGAWAADKITSADIAKNAIRSKHIKKSAVKTSKIADHAVTADKLADGVAGLRGEQGLPGEQGPAGQDATNLFAYIVDNGGGDTASVHYGSGVTAVGDPAGDNNYTLTFNRSLVNCVVQAGAGYGNPAGSSTTDAAIPIVSMEIGNPNQVHVFFENAVGTTIDTAFLVTAFC